MKKFSKISVVTVLLLSSLANSTYAITAEEKNEIQFTTESKIGPQNEVEEKTKAEANTELSDNSFLTLIERLDELEKVFNNLGDETGLENLSDDAFAEEFDKNQAELTELETRIKSLVINEVGNNDIQKGSKEIIEKIDSLQLKAKDISENIANARTEKKYNENLEIAKEKNEEEEIEKEKQKNEDQLRGITRSGEIEVANGVDFISALKDKTNTKITLTNDIKIEGNVTRTAAIEIDGANHTIDVNKRNFFDAKTPKGDVIKWSNVTFKNFVQSESNFMTGTNGSTIIHFHNVIGGSVDDAPRRFVSSPRSKLIFSGINKFHARGELFMLGGAEVMDGTTLDLYETLHNWSIFWFSEASAANNTGDEQLIIGKNANVSARMLKKKGDGDYPAVFYACKTIDIGEGSVYLAHSAKEAIRSDLRQMTFSLGEHALINATSIGDYGRNIIGQKAGSVSIKAEKNSEFYAIGQSTTAAVGAKNLYLDSPKRYDIRTSSAKGVAVTSGTNLTIENTDVGLWKTANKNYKGPADESYTVQSFHANGKTAEAISDKGEELPGLAAYPKTSYRRIAGFNSFPEVQIDPLTDAEKKAPVRVKVGQTPADDFNEDGSIKWEDVYAGKDQAEVTLVDTFGETRKGMTGERDGYAEVDLTKYNEAYKKVTAKVKAINGRESKETKEKPVLDITPPQPAVIFNNKTEQTSKEVIEIGQNETTIKGYLPNEIYDNPGTAKFVLWLMDGDKKVSEVTVSKDQIKDGKVPFEFKELDLYSFAEGKTLQVVAQDSASDGSIMVQPEPSAAEKEAAEKEGRDPVLPDPIDGYSELAEKPETRFIEGNITPTKDVTYRDATFEAGTVITIVEPKGSLDIEIPDSISFGKQELSSGVMKLKPKEVTGRLAVLDDRVVEKTQWTLRVKEVQPLTSDTHTLEGVLKYKIADKVIPLSAEFNELDSDKLDPTVDEKVYSDVWTNNETDQGLFLELPFSKQKPGNYSGVIEWSLLEGPGDSIE